MNKIYCTFVIDTAKYRKCCFVILIQIIHKLISFPFNKYTVGQENNNNNNKKKKPLFISIQIMHRNETDTNHQGLLSTSV